MIWKALILGLLAFAALTIWKSARNDRLVEAEYPPEGTLITVGGKQVHYVDQGTGPVVLLLHGAGGSTRDMTFSLAGRMAQTHRVITVDRPGHGFSDPLHSRGESPQEQARHLWALVDALGLGDGPIRIAGYSYGGAVALAMALAAPDRVAGMLLVAPVTNRWDVPPSRIYDLMGHRWLSWWTNPIASAWLSEGYIRRSFEGVYAPEALPAGLMDHFGPRMTTRKVTLRANARQVITLLPHVKAMEADYASLTLPIEILHGDQDGSLSVKIHAEVLAGQIASAHLKILKGVGHGIHNTQTAEVMQAFDRMITRSAAAQSR